MSIVVPTLECSQWVRTALNSLVEAKRCYAGPAEIIVSDASEREAGEIEKASARAGARYVHGRRGVSRQRNRGAELASFPLLVFIDSDCEAERTFLTEIGNALADPSVIAVAGHVQFTGQRKLIFRAAATTGVLDAFHGFTGKDGPVPWAVTANFAVRRENFIQIGGFDETFPPAPGGEDVDFGLRLAMERPVIVYRSRAVVRHPTDSWSDFARLARRFWSYGRADVYLLLKHPFLGVIDGPNLLLGVCLFALACVCQSIRHHRLIWLSIPLLWWLATLALFAMFTPGSVTERIERSLGLVLVQFLDAGRVVEAMRRLKLRLVWTRVHLDDAQTARDWPTIHRTWLAAGSSALLCNIFAWLFCH